MKIKVLQFFSASFELILAALLWGFGFVAVIWALGSWGAAQLVFLRFLFAAVAGLLISFVFTRPSKAEMIALVRATFWPAFWLVALQILQTWGLLYTSATKSGFITIFYVVLVPVFESVWGRKKQPWLIWFFVAVSLLGIFLIVDPSWDQGWNKGDFLTLLCSVAAALQIIAVDRASGGVTKFFLFNSLQSAWGLVLAMLILPFCNGSLIPTAPPTALAWIGLISLCVGSQLIAFYLQVRAQKVLSPTVSSLFFLLESPFALLFAFWLLHEHLSFKQGVGAVLLLVSALSATIRESRQKKSLPASD